MDFSNIIFLAVIICMLVCGWWIIDRSIEKLRLSIKEGINRIGNSFSQKEKEVE